MLFWSIRTVFCIIQYFKSTNVQWSRRSNQRFPMLLMAAEYWRTDPCNYSPEAPLFIYFYLRRPRILRTLTLYSDNLSNSLCVITVSCLITTAVSHLNNMAAAVLFCPKQQLKWTKMSWPEHSVESFHWFGRDGVFNSLYQLGFISVFYIHADHHGGRNEQVFSEQADRAVVYLLTFWFMLIF